MNKYWRVGRQIPLNIYDGDGHPVCQCHSKEDAADIVAAVNTAIRTGEMGDPPAVDVNMSRLREAAPELLTALYGWMMFVSAINETQPVKRQFPAALDGLYRQASLLTGKALDRVEGE